MYYDNNNNVYNNVYINTQQIYCTYSNSCMYYNNEGVSSQVHDSILHNTCILHVCVVKNY